MNPWLKTPETRLLLQHFTGKEKTWWLTHPEARPSSAEQALLQAALARLEAGEPLPYILQRWEFYGLEFEIGPEALIPRPETELLIETASRWLKESASPQTASRPGLDIATGSGIIPVTLAHLHPQARFVATDISAAALSLAGRNAQKHAVDQRITFHQGDLLAALPPQKNAFSIISANLPYIPTETLRSLPIYGHEPTLALDGGPDGLTLLRRLIEQLQNTSLTWGLLLLEIEYRQGEAVRSLLRQAFPRAQVNILPDLAGLDRLALAAQPD